MPHRRVVTRVVGCMKGHSRMMMKSWPYAAYDRVVARVGQCERHELGQVGRVGHTSMAHGRVDYWARHKAHTGKANLGMWAYYTEIFCRVNRVILMDCGPTVGSVYTI